MSFPEALVVFCDDVRQEANQKLLFIGIYAGGMNVHPIDGGMVVVSQLSVLTFIRWRNPDDVSALKLEVMLHRHPIPLAMVEVDPSGMPDELQSPLGRGMLTQVIVTGIPVVEPTALEVYLTAKGERRMVGWLPIRVAPPNAIASPAERPPAAADNPVDQSSKVRKRSRK